jgi:hypothetical protein
MRREPSVDPYQADTGCCVAEFGLPCANNGSDCSKTARTNLILGLQELPDTEIVAVRVGPGYHYGFVPMPRISKSAKIDAISRGRDQGSFPIKAQQSQRGLQ